MFDTTGTHNLVRSTSGLPKSSRSLWSIPSSATHMNDPPGSTKLVSQPPKSTTRALFPIKPSSHNLPGSLLKLIFGTRRTRRKRLVIGGISRNDRRRYEAAKRWCEVSLFSQLYYETYLISAQSFGEIGSITRGPNGNILVDFRKAEVADTVCPNKFPPSTPVADMHVFRCVVFELVLTSPKLAAVPSRGIL